MSRVWTPTTSPFDDGGWAWRGKWIDALGLFVVVGLFQSGPAYVCATSPDGIAWTGQGLSEVGDGLTYLGDVAWDGTVAIVARNDGVWTSPDCVTWTNQGNPLTSTCTAYSDDHGATWTEVDSSPLPDTNFSSYPVTVDVGPGGRIVVGGTTSVPKTPWVGDNGIDGVYCVRYISEFGLYVAVGNESNIIYSSDATSWTYNGPSGVEIDDSGNSWFSIIYNPTYGLVVVGNNGGGGVDSLFYMADPTALTATLVLTPNQQGGGDETLSSDLKLVLGVWIIIGGTVNGDDEQPSAIWEGTDGVLLADWTADVSGFDLDGSTAGYGLGLVYDDGAPAVLALGVTGSEAGPTILYNLLLPPPSNTTVYASFSLSAT